MGSVYPDIQTLRRCWISYSFGLRDRSAPQQWDAHINSMKLHFLKYLSQTHGVYSNLYTFHGDATFDNEIIEFFSFVHICIISTEWIPRRCEKEMAILK